MSKLDVDNIITISNLFEIISATKQKVGYEFQAPLDEATENEVASKTIRERIGKVTRHD